MNQSKKKLNQVAAAKANPGYWKMFHMCVTRLETISRLRITAGATFDCQLSLTLIISHTHQ